MEKAIMAASRSHYIFFSVHGNRGIVGIRPAAVFIYCPGISDVGIFAKSKGAAYVAKRHLQRRAGHKFLVAIKIVPDPITAAEAVVRQF